MIKQNEVWDLKYSIDPNLSGNDIFEIVYELPYDRISTSLEIPPALIKPKFKVIEQVIFYDLHKDGWTGKLRNLTFRININSNSTETFWLKSLDIILHVNENFTPLIMAENLNFNVNPGINSLIKTVECDLPARFFMTRDIDCDLRFYYSASNTMDVCQINNIPITVNDF